jgi:chromosome segregation ATPase
VQVESHNLAPVRAKALSVLSKKCGVARSGALISVMSALKAGGHFDKIIASIDTMLKALSDEERQDRKDNDECIEKETKGTQKHEDLEYGIARLQNKIDKLTDRQTKLETQSNNVQLEIENHVSMMEQAKEDREAEHGRFLQSQADDTQAVTLLQQATKALSAYSNNNLLLQKPEFKRSKDLAPEAEFSSKDKHKLANNGILAILAQITENLQRELAEGIKQEASDQDEYEKQRADDRQTHQTLKDNKADLLADIAETKADIEELEQNKANTETERDATVATLKELKPGCDWIRQNFDNRRFLRKQEVEGLMEAKGVLAGADLSGGSFLQRK